MAGWFGKPSQFNMPSQAQQTATEMEIRQAEYLAEVAKIQAQQNYHQHLLNQAHTHAITTSNNPYAQLANTPPGGMTRLTAGQYASLGQQYAQGITATSTAGMGPIFPPGSIAQQGYPSYYVQLPVSPREGDTVTVYYQNGRWLEKNNFSQREVEARDSGPGFSLKEIEEAEKIMADCHA